MKLTSLDHYELDIWKLCGVGLVAGLASAVGFFAAFGALLGDATAVFATVLCVTVLYLVVSAPRRALRLEALAQSGEAVMMSVAAAASLKVTRSSSRTLLMLKSRESGIEEALKDAKRSLLLGDSVEVAANRAATRLASYSASNVLKGIASLRTASEGGEENQGINSANELVQETKLPVYTTVCFFAPIMLLLFSVFSHVNDPTRLADLVALEVVVLDVGFNLCSTERHGLA